MQNIVFLSTILLKAVFVHGKFQHYTYYESPKWWFSNYAFFPLPSALVAANENPAASVSVPLGHSLPYVLRTNVSELAVGNNATDDDGEKIPNAHIVATTFDLTYVGSLDANTSGAGINANSSKVTLLWSVAYNYDFPQSVLDAYDANNPGDCTKPLGTECVRALERTPITTNSVFEGMHISGPECSDVLGKLADELPDFSILSPSNDIPPDATNWPFLWLASGAFSGRDQDALDDELSKMQLIGITANEVNKDGTTKKVTSVMCIRVGGKAVSNIGGRSIPNLAFAASVVAIVIGSIAW